MADKTHSDKTMLDKTTPDTNKLERELASRLRESEQQLDTSTLSALATARKQALAANTANGESSSAIPWQGWLLAASVALIALLVALPAQQPKQVTEKSSEVMALEEGPHEDLELFENLEFYEWLAYQEDLG